MDADLAGGLKLDRTTGIGDNTAARLVHDAAGGFWVGNYNGLSRIELAAGGSVFDERGRPVR